MPVATAKNKADAKRAANERFDKVSLISPNILPMLIGALAGGGFKSGINRCVPSEPAPIDKNIRAEANAPYF